MASAHSDPSVPAEITLQILMQLLATSPTPFDAHDFLLSRADRFAAGMPHMYRLVKTRVRHEIHVVLAHARSRPPYKRGGDALFLARDRHDEWIRYRETLLRVCYYGRREGLPGCVREFQERWGMEVLEVGKAEAEGDWLLRPLVMKVRKEKEEKEEIVKNEEEEEPVKKVMTVKIGGRNFSW